MPNETWRPVADGEYESQHVTDSCIVEGEWLTVQERIVLSGGTQVATIALLENLRLCERVEARPEAGPLAARPGARPRPDWSVAPKWAMWWACNYDGTAYWHEEQPYHAFGATWRNARRQLDINERVIVPLGTDWRLLVERRPELLTGAD